MPRINIEKALNQLRGRSFVIRTKYGKNPVEVMVGPHCWSYNAKKRNRCATHLRGRCPAMTLVRVDKAEPELCCDVNSWMISDFLQYIRPLSKGDKEIGIGEMRTHQVEKDAKKIGFPWGIGEELAEEEEDE